MFFICHPNSHNAVNQYIYVFFICDPNSHNAVNQYICVFICDPNSHNAVDQYIYVFLYAIPIFIMQLTNTYMCTH
jgi:hypothetical protein